MHNAGIQGKMWRMVTTIYNKVESCVLVDGKETSWFEVEVGVRQGCVLSPILFSIFVDGLARKIKESGMGVEVEGGEYDKLGLLMYADDIVLIANNEQELQNMIDIVVNYSHKWRFELNHKKTEIVIFGRKSTDHHFFLRAYNGVEMKELMIVPEYTYLGVIFKQNRCWNDFKSKAIGKARRCMAMTWGMGIHVGGLSAKAAINAWKALIRPVLEYGAEVIQYSKNASGSWPEADQIQMQMGRRILGCHPKTANAAVKGELGWQSLKARRDMLRLRYWGKLVSMSSKRWTRRIYDKSRDEYTELGRRNWCTYTHHLLKDLGLEASWDENNVGTMKEWNAKVDAAIKVKEIQRWKDEVQSSCVHI